MTFDLSAQETARLLFTSSEWSYLFGKVSKPELRESWWRLYRMYLDSLCWKSRRLERLAIDDSQCTYCGARNTVLQIHHLTYERVGNEDVNTDLTTLCETCHSKAHQKEKKI